MTSLTRSGSRWWGSASIRREGLPAGEIARRVASLASPRAPVSGAGRICPRQPSAACQWSSDWTATSPGTGPFEREGLDRA